VAPFEARAFASVGGRRGRPTEREEAQRADLDRRAGLVLTL
jgi:hypothetical protein